MHRVELRVGSLAVAVLLAVGGGAAALAANAGDGKLKGPDVVTVGAKATFSGSGFDPSARAEIQLAGRARIGHSDDPVAVLKSRVPTRADGTTTQTFVWPRLAHTCGYCRKVPWPSRVLVGICSYRVDDPLLERTCHTKTVTVRKARS